MSLKPPTQESNRNAISAWAVLRKSWLANSLTVTLHAARVCMCGSICFPIYAQNQCGSSTKITLSFVTLVTYLGSPSWYSSTQKHDAKGSLPPSLLRGCKIISTLMPFDRNTPNICCLNWIGKNENPASLISLEPNWLKLRVGKFNILKQCFSKCVRIIVNVSSTKKASAFRD